MMARIAASLVLAALLTGPANADGPVLQMPAACTVGESCWLANLVDLDPGPGVSDYACGTLAYDGHKGTDFAIRDRGVMDVGVAVLAAAPGTVLRVRDGETDHDGSRAAVRATAGRDCGNGLVIDHGGGWQTQYCHLRNGSIDVRPGTAVDAGTPIGLIGMSGRTVFPHVHVSLRRGDTIIDPFLGTSRPEPGHCGPGAAPNWAPEVMARLPYQTGQLFHAGFAPGRPDPAVMRRGGYRDPVLPRSSGALAVWLEIYAPRRGDKVEYSFTGPDGRSLFQDRKPVTRDQARLYLFGGIRRPASGWPAGLYTGRVAIIPGTPHTPAQKREFTVDLR